MSLFLTVCGTFLGGGYDEIAPHTKPLPEATLRELAARGMTANAPIFIRIFKEESELEIWKLKDDGFALFKTYPICKWSGDLGPKLKQGDKQAPEGFYTVTPGQMNPNSKLHLSFNLGYPNPFDRANDRNGSALMVHGKCESAGCYAMTDALIEEIYALARDAFAAGQSRFHVHAYPFRMTQANLDRHRQHRSYRFWSTLKEGFDAFETSRKPPVIKVCGRQYLVNAHFPGFLGEPDPAAACPQYARLDPDSVPALDTVPVIQVAAVKPTKTVQPAQVAAAVPAAAMEVPVLTLDATQLALEPTAQSASVRDTAPEPPIPAETQQIKRSGKSGKLF